MCFLRIPALGTRTLKSNLCCEKNLENFMKKMKKNDGKNLLKSEEKKLWKNEKNGFIIKKIMKIE